MVVDFFKVPFGVTRRRAAEQYNVTIGRRLLFTDDTASKYTGFLGIEYLILRFWLVKVKYNIPRAVLGHLCIVYLNDTVAFCFASASTVLLSRTTLALVLRRG